MGVDSAGRREGDCTAVSPVATGGRGYRQAIIAERIGPLNDQPATPPLETVP